MKEIHSFFESKKFLGITFFRSYQEDTTEWQDLDVITLKRLSAKVVRDIFGGDSDE